VENFIFFWFHYYFCGEIPDDIGVDRKTKRGMSKDRNCEGCIFTVGHLFGRSGKLICPCLSGKAGFFLAPFLLFPWSDLSFETVRF